MQQELIEQIKRHEGLRLKPYKCTMGALTIGYGRNLDSRGITTAEAQQMLLNDLNEVLEHLTSTWPDILSHDSVRQAAFVNMAFNLGVSGFMKFHKMHNALSLKDYETAAKEMLDSRWAEKQVGSRAIELAKQVKTGEFQ